MSRDACGAALWKQPVQSSDVVLVSEVKMLMVCSAMPGRA